MYHVKVTMQNGTVFEYDAIKLERRVYGFIVITKNTNGDWASLNENFIYCVEVSDSKEESTK